MRTPMQRTMSPRWKALIAAIIAYFGVHAVAAAFGFEGYRLFSDAFDLRGFLIDLALWTVIFVSAHWLMTRRTR